MTGWSARREAAVLLAVVLLSLVPFLGKAFSIDAPVFLAVARQIVAEPGDPFGFEMVWDSSSPDVARFNRNPPLLSYYLAPFLARFGDSEVALHAAALLFPGMAALCFLGIARRLTGQGLGPALLLVCSPAFLVLSTTLMLDVPVLAWMLLAVYALLRGRESASWQLVAGCAAAAAGLTKYVGFAAAPLLAAGCALLYPRRLAPVLRCLLPPLAVWGLWGAYTAQVYGAVHFLSSTDVIFRTNVEWEELGNQVLSVPVYYGAALLFPIGCWLRALATATRGTELAVACVVLAVAVLLYVLPEGEPPRRVPLEAGSFEFVLGALGFAGGAFLWSIALASRRTLASGEGAFLALWLAGLVVFSAFLNWHVNAADALLAAPPALLLLFRDPTLRPGLRWLVPWLALMLPLSLLLARADADQADTYRQAARRIVAEIGDLSGKRWLVGHWGLQHYLGREGFRPVPPPTYGRAELARGDWVATARNVSQLDVVSAMNRYSIQLVWTWEQPARMPLRTTNAEAGAGFYSHHSGYVPFGWSDEPLDELGLGRVAGSRGSR